MRGITTARWANETLAELVEWDEWCLEITTTNAGLAVYYNEFALDGFSDSEREDEGGTGHVWALGPYADIEEAQAAAEAWLLKHYQIEFVGE